MRAFALCSLVLLGACGTEKVKENPTNCAVRDVESGVEFSCTDKNGAVTTGVVKHGEQGAQGEKGEAGPKGEGLKVVKSQVCKGAIEGWLEKSSYEVEVSVSKFETGSVFITSLNKLVRGGETLNQRSSAAFFVAEMKDMSSYDGILMFTHKGDKVDVVSAGGLKTSIPCSEVN